MTPGPQPFVVADINARGELMAKEEYRYDHLAQIPGAPDLIGQLSGHLWREPEGFDEILPSPSMQLTFRWRSCAETGGIATLRYEGQLVALTLLVCGISADQDALILQTFQRHLLLELRDTGFEPAFALLDIPERPLAATINFQPPSNPQDQFLAALSDRCFAASYFRYHSLA